MTLFPEIFEALAAEFHRDEVKSRKQAGRELWYITARTAENRLDAVLGPENWEDDLIMISENSFLCKLTVTLPDGRRITKCDVGGMAGMSDAGDDDKSGASDAFKRAAVKFGVGRYLYRDGVPSYARGEEAPAPEPAPRRADAPAETWSRWIGPRIRRANAEWVREMAREGVEPHVREEHKELTNEPRAVNHLISRLIELGELREEAVSKPGKPGVRDITLARKAVVLFFEQRPKALKKGVEKYVAAKLNEARAKLGLSDPDAHDEADAGHPEAYEDASRN